MSPESARRWLFVCNDLYHMQRDMAASTMAAVGKGRYR